MPSPLMNDVSDEVVSSATDATVFVNVSSMVSCRVDAPVEVTRWAMAFSFSLL